MQVEVNKIEGQLFSVRIFCEKRPGVFVKLMQNLDVLGFDIVNANITTFRGLVLNILNAEVTEDLTSLTTGIWDRLPVVEQALGSIFRFSESRLLRRPLIR
jgi:hypothetical protein